MALGSCHMWLGPMYVLILDCFLIMAQSGKPRALMFPFWLWLMWRLSVAFILTCKSHDSLMSLYLLLPLQWHLLPPQWHLVPLPWRYLLSRLHLLPPPWRLLCLYHGIPYWVPPLVYKASEVVGLALSSTLITSLALYPCAPFLSLPPSTQTT